MTTVLVAVLMVTLLLAAALTNGSRLWAGRWRNRLHIRGCCSSCSGRGAGGAAMVETHGGLCWDCRATGHAHKRDWWNR